MKRVVPNSFLGKLKIFISAYRYRILSFFLWLLLVVFSAHSWAQKPMAVAMGQVCITTQSVKKGDLLESGSVSKKTIPLDSVPQNAIQECDGKELFAIPTLLDMQAGDVLQLSMFQKPEELISLKDEVSKQHHIVYLPMKDFHSVPQPLEIGQFVSILGKAKKSEEAIILLPAVQIADLSIIIEPDTEQELIQGIGLAVEEKSALSLTKALADGWFLIAVTR